MKYRSTQPWLVPLCAAGLLLMPSWVWAEEIQWRANYNAARQEAKERSKPLVLDFYMVPCPWCDKLEQNTFRDPAVSKLVNKQFVPLRLEGPRQTELITFLHISSYPTVVFADPDGKILGTIEGYKDAGPFYEMLQRTMTRVANPEWMVRDFKKAEEAFNATDYPAALALLKTIVEDGKARPIQERARQLLSGIERQAASRMAQARQLTDKGQSEQAVKMLTEVVRVYAGTQEAREAGEMLTRMVVQRPEAPVQQRARRAKELLAQAKEDYRTKQYIWCLDRCELLSASYGDLPEGVEAMQLAAEIRSNPEWMQNACDGLAERLSNMYLGLADSWLKKGQPQQALQCLERVSQTFPGSHQAEVARIRSSQIRGEPTRMVDFQKQ